MAEPGHRARVRHDHVRVDRRRVVRRVRVVVSANTVKYLQPATKIFSECYSQNDVRSPHAAIRQSYCLDAAEIGEIPRQVSVVPNLKKGHY